MDACINTVGRSCSARTTAQVYNMTMKSSSPALLTRYPGGLDETFSMRSVFHIGSDFAFPQQESHPAIIQEDIDERPRLSSLQFGYNGIDEYKNEFNAVAPC